MTGDFQSIHNITVGQLVGMKHPNIRTAIVGRHALDPIAIIEAGGNVPDEIADRYVWLAYVSDGLTFEREDLKHSGEIFWHVCITDPGELPSEMWKARKKEE